MNILHRLPGLLFTLLALPLLLAGCAGLPDDPAQRTVSVPSPNHNERRPNFVILHDTASNDAGHALRTLTDPVREVSAHYLIGRDGLLHVLVDESRRAWHAGESYWGGHTDINSVSIGIELDNTGAEPYPEAQVGRLLALLGELRTRYRIPAANFLAHGDIAPRRKVDPGPFFPWERLAQAGFGLWCQSPEVDAGALPDAFLALQAVGYDIADPAAALNAFRRHFFAGSRRENGAADFDASPAERQLLACLIRDRNSQRLNGE